MMDTIASIPRSSMARQRLEWLVLAAVLTFASHTVTDSLFVFSWPRIPESLRATGGENFWYLLSLLFGLALALTAPRRSGLRIGGIRAHFRGVLIVCGLPVVLAAVIYPLLPVHPFSGAASGLWIISPPAQDLLFIGYLYGRFEPLFPDFVHPRIRLRWALVVSALFFSAWHLPNFSTIPAEFVLFQLCYTFAIFIVAGLSRQWTGSMLYFTLCHMGINFIAWWVK
jgi:membrane protease YdiL (CAAX protease family)